MSSKINYSGMRKAVQMGLLLFAGTHCVYSLNAADEEILEKLKALEAQNAHLMALIEQQQTQIEELSSRIGANEEREEEVAEQLEELEDELSDSFSNIATSVGNAASNLRISGEAAVAFFGGESNTQFPNEEFRIDEARLFFEAEVASDIYLFSSLFLFNRDMDNSNVFVGELYIDWEDPFNLNHSDRLVNLRAGQFPIPYGMEYENRYIMENPLISRTLQDIMGMDQGLSLFGEVGDFSYVLAVQNGGASVLRDLDSDKSVTVRATYDATDWLSLVGSYHTTGDVAVGNNDKAGIWFGGGLLRSIGSEATQTFKADMAQVDVNFTWENGWSRVTVGNADYSDSDPLANNRRDMDYYSLELVQFLSPQWHVAARAAQIQSNGGYTIPGIGSRDLFHYSGILTEDLDRIALGLGYWPADNVVTKIEYTFEDRELPDGSKSKDGDQIAAQVGIRY